MFLSLSLLSCLIAIEMILPQIIGSTINGLRISSEIHRPFDAKPFVLLFISLVLVRGGVGVILGPIRNRLIHLTLSDVRLAIYNSIQRLAFRYHDKVNSGELINRSTTDISRLQEFLLACLLLTLDIAGSLVATTVFIFLIHPALGWLTVFTAGPTIFLIVIYSRKLQPQWKSVHHLHGTMTTIIQENIAGVRVVKAFAREDAQIEKFKTQRDTYLHDLLKTVNYWASRVPFAQFVFGLSTPLILWVGGSKVIDHQLSVGDLAKVIFYLMAINHRVGMIGQFTNIIQNANSSSERILEIIHEKERLIDGQKIAPEIKGEVQFCQVSFGYKEALPALNGITFTATAGSTIGIVGATGAGKTTLVNLIPRFYDPIQGKILVDGVDIREFNLESYRQQIGIIFQETFLFTATIAENISYGRPDVTFEEIQRCSRAAQAEEFILGMEKGYNTLVGERGVSLSGGQKQRLAIARAFLMNPRILIFDDATASVDSHTEQLIRKAMQDLCKGRTSFVIAHRLSTVQSADYLLVLEEGRLVEQGTHEELLKKNGHYVSIFNQQIRKEPAFPS
ncbi:MAG: multidrug transporter ATP-binding protein [Verrucomicrobiales bacterium]|nr:multidrug transporter ATP-binding protein [Verrucomicrobiales bacterium]